MKSSEVRESFIEFFKSKNHTFVPSSSTIPFGDQTILFTIAGMAQFKAALTGAETRPYKRATNSQKCIRIGDLDDVGKDGRHCTMFEMLGSWSFGDYYKKDAIAWAYELTTKVYRFDTARLWVTVHDSDDEAERLWQDVGMPKERIRRLGDKDNFWAMGPTGPCGPCSELYIDQGVEVGKCTTPGFTCLAGPGCDCDRYLEFWNLVFMQYDRQDDGTLKELPMKSVDTGSGLERVTALLQGKTSAFEIDSFDAVRNAILKTAGLTHDALSDAKTKVSVNVICDHIRTLLFPLADGAHFGAEGRGYVLRRVLRRAVRHAHKLAPGFAKSDSFLARIVPAVVAEFGAFYPELKEHEKRATKSIFDEEIRFNQTLEAGIVKFQSFTAAARREKRNRLTGHEIFVLHDSFGFPSDLTRVLCEEAGIDADMAGFEVEMKGQKEKSRADAKFYKFDDDDSPWVQLAKSPTEDARDELAFSGYGISEPSGRAVNGAGEEVDVADVVVPLPHVRRVRQLKNRLFELVLARTPFYPEGGGQVADVGFLRLTKDKGATKIDFEVLDVRKTPSAVVHLLKQEELSADESPAMDPEALRKLFALSGTDSVLARVDVTARAATARNHTATHLLHKSLQLVLGDSVRQAGSMVSPKGLRFDFSASRPMTDVDVQKVEDLTNAQILRNAAVSTHEDVKIEDAKSMGAMAIFDEKYDDLVRVLEVPGFSMELCGGTHVTATGSIGLFKILSESSVTAGVRRIEAVTGTAALEYLRSLKRTLRETAESVKATEHDLPGRVQDLKDQIKERDRAISQLQSRLANSQLDMLLGKSRATAAGLKVLSAVVETSDPKELELLSDRVKEKGLDVVLLGADIQGKAVILASVSKAGLARSPKLNAGALVRQLSEKVGGKGGGRPDFARGGGTETGAALAQAMDDGAGLVEAQTHG